MEVLQRPLCNHRGGELLWVLEAVVCMGPSAVTCPCTAEAADGAAGYVQGEGGLYYAGAWCGYGFHEDGLKAGMAAAVALGATIPWSARSACPKISLADGFFLGTFERFARMAISLGSLRLILPNGEERLYGSQDAHPSVPGEVMQRVQTAAASLGASGCT